MTFMSIGLVFVQYDKVHVNNNFQVMFTFKENVLPDLRGDSKVAKLFTRAVPSVTHGAGINSPRLMHILIVFNH